MPLEIRDDEQLLRQAPRPSARIPEPLRSHSLGGCCAKTCLFGFGGVVGTIGILLGILWPVIVNTLLGSQLALAPGSTVYEKWVETPIPMYFHIYLYNWTNPEGTLKHGEKPNFAQVGPYTFSEHHSKKNITWNDNNDTVTYFNQKQYHYLPELSNGSLSDRITNVNVIAVVVGWYCRNMGLAEKMAVNLVLFDFVEKSLVKTDTAKNLLFDGSQDPLLDIFQKLRIIIKALPAMKKFAWFYGKNYTLTGDGVFTMHTGQDDINNIGLLTDWNYSNRTKFRGDCGKVEGSYGEELPPGTVDSDKILIFANDLCSVVPLRKDRSSSKLGVPSQVFLGKADVFSNTTTCYCETDTNCPATGVRPVFACKNAPVYISWPHFYLADPVYRQMVSGMSPDPNKHQFVMELAEVTSIPMSVRARMQINIHVQPIKGMPFFENLPNAVFPMLWFSQEADMTPDMASQLSILVKAATWGRWLLLGFGAFGGLLIVTGWALQSRGCFHQSDERLLQ